MAGSLIVHLIAGGTLSELSERSKQTLTERLQQRDEQNFVEFELAEAPPKAATPPQASAQQAPPASPAEPKKTNPTKIVELPKAPDEVPDQANYLAERNMRADKETIVKRIGEAENQRKEGVKNGAETASALPQEEIEAKPAVKANAGSAGPADEGEGLAEREKTTADLKAAPILDQGGEVPVPGASAPESQQSMTKGGGKLDGAPATAGQKPLLPSAERLAKLIEPSQRNLIQAQHGDITLLNARSSELAAFVLSRAKRIYSFLNINGPLLTVYYEDVQNLQFPIAMEASINRRGEVVHIATVVSSGSRKIDKLVSDATRSGLHGQEAPPEEGFIDGDQMRFRFALYSDHIEAGLP